MSMSKPSTSPVVGFLKPNGGTSYFTPIVISPASCSLAIVVPAANVRFSAGVVVVAALPPPPSSSSSPQPAATSTPSASARIAIQRHVVPCMCPSSPQ